MKNWFTRKEKQLPHEAKLPNEVQDARIDVHSPTWKFIERWIEERKDHLRRKNDSPQNDDKKTALLRGRIAELQELAKLPESGRDDNRPGILNRHKVPVRNGHGN